ncbi:MAG: 4-alpha-glucanotransferase [Terriglobales bacterium]
MLLHPTSLPSPAGIGDFGTEAYRFIDSLKQSRNKLWQVLPLNPTGYGGHVSQQGSISDICRKATYVFVFRSDLALLGGVADVCREPSQARSVEPDSQSGSMGFSRSIDWLPTGENPRCS